MSKTGPQGYLGSTRWRKTGEFYLDVAAGVYEPNWYNVHKFGRNAAVASGAWELIANLSVVPPWLTAATTVRVQAGGDAADVDLTGAGARTIRVFGLDENLIVTSEDISLAGTSASASTSTKFWRINRAYVLTAGTYATPQNTAAIMVEDTAATLDLLRIEAGEGQTQFCAWSVPTGFTATVLSVSVDVDGNKAADIRMCQRQNLNVTTAPVTAMRLVKWWDGVLGHVDYLPVSPANHIVGPADIWVEARGSGAITEVSCEFELFVHPTHT